MPLRLIEIHLPKDRVQRVREVLEDVPVLSHWHGELFDNLAFVKLLVDAEHTESILHRFEDRCGDLEGCRLVILPVEASLPRPESKEEQQLELHEGDEDNAQAKSVAGRISIEELYQGLIDAIDVSPVYIIMVVLATTVAAIGLLNNDVAVIIGSMVIAPLLTPNMALSLATTLADFPLGRKALAAQFLGVVVVLAVSMGIGSVFSVDPSGPELASRTRVSVSYVVLALATGVAGSLSITTGVSQILVGVMVAVALLPPLVATGLLVGAGYWSEALGSLELFLVNVVSINLAGVATFLVQGIYPRHWWEAQKARRLTRWALGLWTLLLLALVIVILLAQRLPPKP